MSKKIANYQHMTHFIKSVRTNNNTHLVRSKENFAHYYYNKIFVFSFCSYVFKQMKLSTMIDSLCTFLK